ncbi:glycosyltransferase [Streptomyces sp. NBC_00893]|uniref:glycosyltransferase n=1 Tax=Streptomyces sp. NBC_00893 TaxID=2975862 RepID=UPI00225081F3|nr:glycosyltransferase [Streptomyces sp. NBC_00893]MCX4847662.1 glycosyltransferase [Streptomyces sp. NBC_00893]
MLSCPPTANRAVVPAHREQGCLRAAIESVLDRIPGEPELRVVDDGSRDGPYDDGHAAESVVRRPFPGGTEPDRPATGEGPISPVRERPRPVTPGPSRG